MADEQDNLEADIRAAMETVGKAPQTTAELTAAPDGPSPDAPASEGDGARARDESGKFVKTEAKTDAKVPVLDKPAAASAAPVVDQAAKTPAVPAIAPPAGWKGAGKVAWDRLPQDIKKELSEDYASRATTQAKLESFDRAIGPERAQVLAATYGSVEQGLQNLFALSDMATKNPQGFVLWFAQQRGVNLAQMAGQPMGQQGEQPASQAPDPVMQRMSQLETMLGTFVQQQQQGAVAPVIAEVNRFAADPAHPYFNDVREDIEGLLKAGRVKGDSPSERLQNAYDMAIWAHPEIRSSLISKQVEQQSQAQSQAAQQARAASVSVSGSPAGASMPTDAPDETLEQTLRRVQARALSA